MFFFCRDIDILGQRERKKKRITHRYCNEAHSCVVETATKLLSGAIPLNPKNRTNNIQHAQNKMRKIYSNFVSLFVNSNKSHGLFFACAPLLSSNILKYRVSICLCVLSMQHIYKSRRACMSHTQCGAEFNGSYLLSARTV